MLSFWNCLRGEAFWDPISCSNRAVFCKVFLEYELESPRGGSFQLNREFEVGMSMWGVPPCALWL